jgi:hypothetical protein
MEVQNFSLKTTKELFVKKFILLFSISVILLLNACVSNKTNAFDKTYPEPSIKLKYKKIAKYKAILECVSPKVEFKAGSVPQITFRLKNLSSKRLLITEWMMKESNNIKIYYTPWHPGMKIPVKDQWKVISPKIGENPKRMTLDLAHRNSVLLNTNLDFVKDLKIITPQYFMIYGKLNLSSISKRSRFLKIKINP